SLPMHIRLSAANSLVQHAAGGRLSQEHQQRLSRHTAVAMLNEIPLNDPNRFEIAQALALAIDLHSEQTRRIFRSLEDDLAHQRRPLSQQMNTCLRTAAMPELNAAVSFDDEPDSKSFARLLARRQPVATARDQEAVLRAGGEVIVAIAKDPELRARVFAMAES